MQYCRTCNSLLIKRETKNKPSRATQSYYFKAYYYCQKCQKIYHSDKFKIINPQFKDLFSNAQQITPNKLNSNSLRLDKNFDAEIWTDGACLGNGGNHAKAAWAFVSGETEKAGLVPGEKQTNNVAEGIAVLHALRWAAQKKYHRIRVFTDSQITLYNLKKHPHQVKVNQEIFKSIATVIKESNLTVIFEKVVGHSGDPNNDRADRLANSLAGLS